MLNKIHDVHTAVWIPDLAEKTRARWLETVFQKNRSIKKSRS